MATDPALLGERLRLRVLMCGDQIVDLPWNRFRDNCFPYWTVYINAAPGAAVRLDGRLHPLRPGHAYLLPAWVRYDCVTSGPVPHLWALFDICGLPGSLVRECFPTLRTLPLSEPLAAAAQRMRQALAGAYIDHPATVFAVKALLYSVVADLFTGLPAREAQRLLAPSAAGSPIAPAIDLIDQRLSRPVGNHALARACGFSQEHFVRLFRQQMGQTPAQYVLERRIAEAARLLTTDDQGIDAIAVACGFPDRFHFSRTFSRRMGIPPATYRRMKLG